MKVNRELVAPLRHPQEGAAGPPFPQFNDYSRLYVDGQEYTNQPVLFLVQLGETAQRPPSQRLTVWLMHFLVIVLFRGDTGPNATVQPEQYVNMLIDSIEQAICPVPGMRQQLTAATAACRWSWTRG